MKPGIEPATPGLSGHQILTSVKGHNSVVNEQKMTGRLGLLPVIFLLIYNRVIALD